MSSRSSQLGCGEEPTSLKRESLRVRRVLMRADGGADVGLGHLSRLRAIAQAVLDRGSTVSMLGRGIEDLPQSTIGWSWRGMGDAPSSVGSEAHDADRVVDMAGADAADVVVVDHYGLGEDWERRVKDGLPEATIVALDDLPGRRHAADVLIDPNLGGDGPGLAANVNGRFLRGLSYVPLDDDYLHASDPDARSSGRPNILVALGSASNELVQNLAVAFVDDSRTRDTDIVFVVPDAGVRETVRGAVRDHASVTVFGSLPSLRPLTERADLVVGAGGTSAWQRLRLGRASVVVALADNQIRTCKALNDCGLATWVQDTRHPSDLVDAIFVALGDRSLARRAQSWGPVLVDGLGAKRIAFAIAPSRTFPEMRRAADRDASALLGIANDPATRAASRTTQAIGPDEHLAWLQSVLRRGQAPFWVAESGGLVVGQVRFADLGEAWELGYGLDPIARGLGWSAPLVTEGIRRVREHRDAPIVAVVGDGNEISHHMLQGLGFRSDPEGRRSRALGARVGAGFSAYLLDPGRPAL